MTTAVETIEVMEVICVNRPLADTLSNAGRVYSAARVAGYCFTYVIEIVQLEQNRVLSREVYGVEVIGEWVLGSRREFAVCKCDAAPTDDLSGLYFVSVPGTGPDVPEYNRLRPFKICWCRGFGRWQVCKHFDVLSDLIKRGEL